jgi:hypothetical protein
MVGKEVKNVSKQQVTDTCVELALGMHWMLIWPDIRRPDVTKVPLSNLKHGIVLSPKNLRCSENVFENRINKYSYLFDSAGYPAILSIRYPVGYPASQIRYLSRYRISKRSVYIAPFFCPDEKRGTVQ